jgi:hypothetical protein
MLVALVGLSLAPPRARKSKAAMAYAEQVGPEAFYLFGTGLGDGLPELQAEPRLAAFRARSEAMLQQEVKKFILNITSSGPRTMCVDAFRNGCLYWYTTRPWRSTKSRLVEIGGRVM